MPKISMKGLSQFMTSGAARQRSILRDHKFPKGAMVQIVYYSEARNAIKGYHENGNDLGILVRAVDSLRKKIDVVKKHAIPRLENNIRAVEAYMRHFGRRKFAVQPTVKLKYTHASVTVSATPDLVVEENAQREIIKLDCNRRAATDEQIQIMLQVMYEGAVAEELGVKPKNVIYLDAIRDLEHVGSKVKKTVKKEIDASCDNIEALWPTIK